MTAFKTLPLDKILVPEDRLRPVEEDAAFMIGQSVATTGMIHPLVVRPTPNGEQPYTLVSGAHRHRGAQLAGLTEVAVHVIKADARQAQIAEIEENLFKNELSALDRAIFVTKYRQLWEEEHGAIDPKGGRPKENSVNMTEFAEDSAQGHFFARISERMGLSRAAIERAQRIGKHLQPALYPHLRGHDEADNQALLLKLAALEPGIQRGLAGTLANGADRQASFDAALNRDVRAALPATQKAINTFASTWTRLNAQAKWTALEEIGITDILTDERKTELSTRFAGKRGRPVNSGREG